MGKKWYNLFVVTDPKPGATPPASPPPAPRRVSEVVPGAAAEVKFEGEVSDPNAFDDIYRSARIPEPAHDYTVLKVAEMLHSEHLKSLPAQVKSKSILVALDAAGVSVEEIVEDAVRRDRALDTFERVLQKNLEDLRSAKDAENKALETELSEKIRDLRARIAANEQDVAREQEQLLAWRTRKRAEEDRIAEAVSFFISENPITRSGPSADPQGGSSHVR